MPLDKIAKMIQEKQVKAFKYHTWRKIESDKGEIRILVLDDGVAHCEYICPKCQHHGIDSSQQWKRPFASKCEKCDAKIAVPKLRDQAKREMKKESAKATDE